MRFIPQPFGEVRLGDFLLDHLGDPQWATFRAAIAFVKRSGTQFISAALQEFDSRATVRVSVGVDFLGTSKEGLNDLLEASPNGKVFVYRNNGPYTFHPKLYLFTSQQRADVVVGSGNMTSGGLFTNYEASLAVSLDLTIAEDQKLLHALEDTLDDWSIPKPGICYLLTQETINQLVASGLVRTEAELLALQKAKTSVAPKGEGKPSPEAAKKGEQGDSDSLFITVPVPPPPVIPGAKVEVISAEPGMEEQAATPISLLALPPTGILPAQGGGVTCFVMTLQNTDVGVGQVTKGTSRRSPEVFIPLAALDERPDFWTFPDQFTEDTKWNSMHNDRRHDIGKMDRKAVPMRIGGIQSVRMFFNPRKGDFRLGNEALRSEGHIGDILFIRRVDPANGFEYDIQVAPQGSPLFQQLEPVCNTPVTNSQKRFGYF